MKRFPWLSMVLAAGAIWLAVQNHRIGAWQETNAVLRSRLAHLPQQPVQPVGGLSRDLDQEIAALRRQLETAPTVAARPAEPAQVDPAARAELESVQKQVADLEADRARRKAWEERRSGYHQLAAMVSGLWQQGGAASWPRTDRELAGRLREFAALISETPQNWDSFPGGVRLDQFEVVSPPVASERWGGTLLLRERRPVEDPEGKSSQHLIFSSGLVLSASEWE